MIRRSPCLLSITLLALALVLLEGRQSQADVKSPRFASGQIGLSSVNNDVGSGVAFGIEGGYFMYENWGLGAYLRAGNHSNDITSFFFGIEGLYRNPIPLGGLTAGLTLGSGKFTAQGLSGNSALAYGVKAAYDYDLDDQPISLGADLSITWCKPGDTMLTTVSHLLTAKWWF